MYEITYSGYLQAVKRRTCAQSFQRFALQQTTLRQFKVARLLCELDVTTSFLHYNHILENNLSLSQPVIDILSIDASALPPQKKQKVNRSLSVYETQFMLEANRLYRQAYHQPGWAFSAILSERLIRQTPDLPTEILFDQNVVDHIESTMQSEMEFVNEKCLTHSRLQLLHKDKKKLCNPPEEPGEDFKRLVEALVAPLVEQYHPDNLDHDGCLLAKRSLLSFLQAGAKRPEATPVTDSSPPPHRSGSAASCGITIEDSG